MINDYSEATVQLVPLATKIELACQDLRWADAAALAVQSIARGAELLEWLGQQRPPVKLSPAEQEAIGAEPS